jgi:hypothetical protein
MADTVKYTELETSTPVLAAGGVLIEGDSINFIGRLLSVPLPLL